MLDELSNQNTFLNISLKKELICCWRRDCLQYWRDIVNNIAPILDVNIFTILAQYFFANIG